MRAECNLSKLKGQPNPYAKMLIKRTPVRAKTHEEVLKPYLRNVKFRKGYERELTALRKQNRF